MPPPSVRPAMPTDAVSPNGMARPCAASASATSTCGQAGLGANETRSGSMCRPFIGDRSSRRTSSPVRVSGEAVTAAANGELEAGLAGERDGAGHVGSVGGSHDQGGPGVDRQVGCARGASYSLSSGRTMLPFSVAAGESRLGLLGAGQGAQSREFHAGVLLHVGRSGRRGDVWSDRMSALLPARQARIGSVAGGTSGRRSGRTSMARLARTWPCPQLVAIGSAATTCGDPCR